MPTIKITNADKGIDVSYSLIAFDEKGNERTDDGEGMMSQNLINTLENEPITDVFIFSHGWLGDVPAAKAQYERWVLAMAERKEDLERIQQSRPGFRPLLIGLHWPSLPFGDENLSNGAVSFGVGDAPTVDPLESMVEFYSARIADTPAAKDALRTIITAAAEDGAPPQLPPEVKEAFLQLDREAGLTEDGPAGAPGADREPFDPERQYFFCKQRPVNFGGGGTNPLLSIVQLFSYRQMKARARSFGENGGFKLLSQLQRARENARFHLMGHSFGCIVVTASACGPENSQLPRPVNSIALVQGALSIWSYCADIPYRQGTPGYFHRLLREGKVSGPIVTTQSENDTAVAWIYSAAAGFFREINFKPGDLAPEYAALGAWGIRGDDLPLKFSDMLPVEGVYSFSPGVIYNLNGTEYIRERSGFGGAHNDIAKPEVAHAIWSAAML